MTQCDTIRGLEWNEIMLGVPCIATATCGKIDCFENIVALVFWCFSVVRITDLYSGSRNCLHRIL